MSKSKKTFIKRNWKIILNVVTVVALAALVYALRHHIVETFNNLSRVNVYVLLLMIPIQVINYHSQVKVYQSLFKLVGNPLKYWPVMGVTLELNFVNQVFPSGGVTGISYFGLRMKDDTITGGKATVVQLIKLFLLFISFEVLLIVALLIMALDGKINNLVMLTAGSISTLLVVGTFIFVGVIGSKQRIHGTLSVFSSGVNKLVHFFRPNKPETIRTARIESVAMELHNNYALVSSSWGRLKSPFFWSIVSNLTEVLTVYVVYAAFGKWVNLGAIILAYAVANFAGLISVLPGGIGVYEALMTGVLAAAGVSPALSLPVTVMYRVLNTLIQLPPGYVLYHRNLRMNRAAGSSSA